MLFNEGLFHSPPNHLSLLVTYIPSIMPYAQRNAFIYGSKLCKPCLRNVPLFTVYGGLYRCSLMFSNCYNLTALCAESNKKVN